MRWIGLIALAAILFSGCRMGRLNPKLFPKEAKSATVTCGRNFDLCEVKADHICGFKGYKILSKQKTEKGYTAQIKCYR